MTSESRPDPLRCHGSVAEFSPAPCGREHDHPAHPLGIPPLPKRNGSDESQIQARINADKGLTIGESMRTHINVNALRRVIE